MVHQALELLLIRIHIRTILWLTGLSLEIQKLLAIWGPAQQREAIARIRSTVDHRMRHPLIQELIGQIHPAMA